jgi:hypothetical protein
VITKTQPDDFARGYFCAVAVLLRLEGTVDANVRELFVAGGHGVGADPEDVALFVTHKLIAIDGVSNGKVD